MKFNICKFVRSLFSSDEHYPDHGPKEPIIIVPKRQPTTPPIDVDRLIETLKKIVEIKEKVKID